MRHPFAGIDWIAAVGRLVEDVAAGRDLAGLDYTVSEEFTDPPAELRRAGSATLGWFLRVRDGRVEVGDRPAPDAELRVVADYATHRALTRRPWRGDVDAIAAARRSRARAVEAGLLRTDGDPAGTPLPVLALIRDLHDPVAALTD